MLYAFVIEDTAVVTSADTQAEFDSYDWEQISKTHQNITVRPLVTSDMANTAFVGLKGAFLVIAPGETERTIKDILKPCGIIVQGRGKVVSQMEKMKADASDQEIETIFSENRSIAEIFGLDKHDPWDRRTDEEKQDEEKTKKAFDEAKKGGKMSGESFDPSAAKDSSARVWDVKGHEENGKIKIDSAIAVKGLWDHLDDAGPLPANPYRIENAHGSLWRTDLIGIDIAQLEAIFIENGTSFERLTVAHGTILEIDLPTDKIGVWTVAGNSRLAEKIADMVKETCPDAVTDVYGVNTESERLIPKETLSGVEVVSNLPREIGPRPWDARETAKDFHTIMRAIPKDDRDKKWRKEVKGYEFIYSGSYSPMTGSTVFVVPLAYWRRSQKFYPHKLNIDHLLPDDFVEEAPGRYRSRSRDWNQATYTMAQAGIEESMMIRLYLNSLET